MPVCFLEAEGKSLLADHKSRTVFIQQELYMLTVQFVALRNYLDSSMQLGSLL